MRRTGTQSEFRGSLALVAILAGVSMIACGPTPDHFKPRGQASQALLSVGGVQYMTAEMSRQGGQIQISFTLFLTHSEVSLSTAIDGSLAGSASAQSPDGFTQYALQVQCSDADCTKFAALLNATGLQSNPNATGVSAELFSGTQSTAPGPCAGIRTQTEVRYQTAADALAGLLAGQTAAGSQDNGGATLGGGGTTTGSGSTNDPAVTGPTQGGSFVAQPDPTGSVPAGI